MNARGGIMRVVRLCLGAALAMALVAAGFAHADVDETGTAAASFLTLGSGARILSMGGATLGLADDYAASAWNPAALGWMERTEIVLSHSSLGDGASQEWAGIGGRWGNAMHWSVSGLYQGEGSFDGRDASNLSTGSFNVSSFAFGAHLARRFGDRVTLGAGAKGVSENLGTVSGFGATFDFGASVRAGDFGFGIAGQNLGGQMKYDGAVYGFPGNVGAGISYTMPNTGVKLALDANFPQSYYKDVRFGAEWAWHDMVAVRAGYRKELGVDSNIGDDVQSGPTFGMGAGRNGFWFDYGYLVSNNGDGQHRIGIRFSPGGFGSFGQTDEPAVASRPVKPAAPKAEPKKAEPKKTDPKSVPVVPMIVKPATPKPDATQPTKQSGDADTPVPNAAPAAKAEVPVATAPKSTPSGDSESKPVPVKVGSKPTPTRIGDLNPPAPAPARTTAPAVTNPPKPAAVRPVEAKPVETKPAEAKPAPAEPKPSESAQASPAKDEVKAANDKPAEPQPAEVKKPEEKKPEKKKPEPAKTEPRPSKVKVKNGETLKIIAQRYGLTPAAIMMENNMVSEKVNPGQTLKLPPEN